MFIRCYYAFTPQVSHGLTPLEGQIEIFEDQIWGRQQLQECVSGPLNEEEQFWISRLPHSAQVAVIPGILSNFELFIYLSPEILTLKSQAIDTGPRTKSKL